MKATLLTTTVLLSFATSTVAQTSDLWSRRGECIEIGKKKLTEELKWYKSADEIKWDWKIKVHTRYDVHLARCYVVIEGYSNSGVSFTNLYDGQTDERIAAANLVHAPGKNIHSWYGEVTEGGYFHELAKEYRSNMRSQSDYDMYTQAQYSETIEFINERMTELK
jgi:hypothetical protein